MTPTTSPLTGGDSHQAEIGISRRARDHAPIPTGPLSTADLARWRAADRAFWGELSEPDGREFTVLR